VCNPGWNLCAPFRNVCRDVELAEKSIERAVCRQAPLAVEQIELNCTAA